LYAAIMGVSDAATVIIKPLGSDQVSRVQHADLLGHDAPLAHEQRHDGSSITLPARAAGQVRVLRLAGINGIHRGTS
jgi:hypothetical protein